MARSNEERLRMAVSMCRAARALVWDSLPADLPEADRRALFLKRYYGDELPAALRHAAAAPARPERAP